MYTDFDNVSLAELFVKNNVISAMEVDYKFNTVGCYNRLIKKLNYNPTKAHKVIIRVTAPQKILEQTLEYISKKFKGFDNLTIQSTSTKNIIESFAGQHVMKIEIYAAVNPRPFELSISDKDWLLDFFSSNYLLIGNSGRQQTISEAETQALLTVSFGGGYCRPYKRLLILSGDFDTMPPELINPAENSIKPKNPQETALYKAILSKTAGDGVNITMIDSSRFYDF